MQTVFVLDRNKNPLMPCHPARARELLRKGKAAVFRRYPFTIILKGREGGAAQPVQAKVDPGSKTTGIALVGDFSSGKKAIWGAELHHRGEAIKKALTDRRSVRRARRNRKTRYRKPRFDNRKRPEGWLPPSLVSRVENILTWINRIRRFAPVTALSMEWVRFDTQKLQNPETSGIEYQQGTLWGYEVREYLLEKWGRKCAYCDAENVPLEVEHVVPKSKGGTDRVSNLTVACRECNQRKGNRSIEEFLARDPERLKRIKAELTRPLKDAAAVNAARWNLFRRLKATGLPIEGGTGGQTKSNRRTQNYPKKHWIDAACVGASGEGVRLDPAMKILRVEAKGHGKRQRCTTDQYGFPKTHASAAKTYLGFRTGDLVRAVIPRGKYAGEHVGRIAIRHRPSFKLNGFNVHPKYLKILQRGDGYAYSME